MLNLFLLYFIKNWDKKMDNLYIAILIISIIIALPFIILGTIRLYRYLYRTNSVLFNRVKVFQSQKEAVYR